MGDNNAIKMTITPVVKLSNSFGDAASVMPNLVLMGPTASRYRPSKRVSPIKASGCPCQWVQISDIGCVNVT